jgi:hypothetical protein
MNKSVERGFFIVHPLYICKSLARTYRKTDAQYLKICTVLSSLPEWNVIICFLQAGSNLDVRDGVPHHADEKRED